MSATHDYRVANRLCVDCAAGLLEEWVGQRCPECKAEAKRRTQRWRAANPGAARALNRLADLRRRRRAVASGICRRCGAPARVGEDGRVRERCDTCTADAADAQVAIDARRRVAG